MNKVLTNRERYVQFINDLKTTPPNTLPRVCIIDNIKVSISKNTTKEVVILFTYLDSKKTLQVIDEDSVELLYCLTTDILDQASIDDLSHEILFMTHVPPQLING